MGEGIGRSKTISDKNGDDDSDVHSQTTDDTADAQDVDEVFKEKDEGEASDQDVEIQETLDGPQTDQDAIDQNWIKATNVNYPLHTYYKCLKRSLSIVFGS